MATAESSGFCGSHQGFLGKGGIHCFSPGKVPVPIIGQLESPQAILPVETGAAPGQAAWLSTSFLSQLHLPVTAAAEGKDGPSSWCGDQVLTSTSPVLALFLPTVS